MASRSIYPPIVNTYEPAFVAGSNSSLRVYFSLSSLSSSATTYLTSISDSNVATAFNIQVQVFNQDGKSVVNTVNDSSNSRYRATGVILNLNAKQVKQGENYFYVTINSSDIKNGWTIGMKYKIQLRLSTVTYNPDTYPKQEVWLQEFSNSFSEWSTYCYTKAISEMTVQIPLFNYDSSDSSVIHNDNTVYTVSDVNFFGSIFNSDSDANELYDSFRVCLYKDDILIEDSGDIERITLGNESESYFEYKFKSNFVNLEEYYISLSFVTVNEYSLDSPLIFRFIVADSTMDPNEVYLTTIDVNYQDLLTDLTSIDKEEDEGRIGLKIYSSDEEPWFGNICIRRASQEDNFNSWVDITTIVVKERVLNELDIIDDSILFFEYDEKGNDTYNLLNNYSGEIYDYIYDFSGKDNYIFSNYTQAKIFEYSGNDIYSAGVYSLFNITDYSGNDKYNLIDSKGEIVDYKGKDTYTISNSNIDIFDYKGKDKFDVVAILDGKVEEVKARRVIERIDQLTEKEDLITVNYRK